jgi:hypothetical protein
LSFCFFEREDDTIKLGLNVYRGVETKLSWRGPRWHLAPTACRCSTERKADIGDTDLNA